MFLPYIIADAFRFCGDFLHVASKIVLITKITKTRSCSGLSLKTQFLYAMVFVFRYIDLLDLHVESPLEVYNFIMKILFIGFQVLILFLMRFKYFSTYDKKWDKFNILVLIIPCFVLSLYFARDSGSFSKYVPKVLYISSLFLESVSILPQLVQLQEAGESETMTSKYILLLGLYRASYTVYFIVKRFYNIRNTGNIPIACGIVQTLLYMDFFAVYYKHVFRKSGISERLPSSNIKGEL
ncbi:ER lumen protein retaining KDEL receptor 2 [Encephalitozoon intestinalis ATCC 50506]|uniref:ER lumen protein retaining KDEL receptor 2 n=1 Tax=Encephalitozoon intestinalis (strain ATCC 50506) TaxID=876142 RepID=E0S7T0_ENCIT|nr:ER lumen protein retaining KDEL receptor 2 [Encephalitozoon intestinalis ATCC 50506]ADM11759.1 ER lumen protein retaining KDEL receptor 2 [Encephalitozoon intestinalis ATCC 50506]UTX45500.1 ER lumen protein retaining KDEL receptor 2 [Encephalitozoon intestinalis]